MLAQGGEGDRPRRHARTPPSTAQVQLLVGGERDAQSQNSRALDSLELPLLYNRSGASLGRPWVSAPATSLPDDHSPKAQVLLHDDRRPAIVRER